MIKFVPLVAGALLVALPAQAADEDAQIWNAATASIDVGDRYVLWLEGQMRWSDDASRLGQVLLPKIAVQVGGGGSGGIAAPKGLQ